MIEVKPYLFIVHNSKGFVNFGFVQKGQELSTNMTVEKFNDIDSWIERINELKGVPNWYDEVYLNE